MPSPSAPLRPRCGVCNSTTNLQRCSACQALSYCSKEHQVIHRNLHKGACKAIKKGRAKMDEEKQKLNEMPEDFLFSANPFETSVGHFWGVLATRPYMRARFALVDEILEIKSFEAVTVAYDHLRDMLRLCRSDNMGVRSMVPAVLLRLGRDQESYDFAKWWLTEGSRGDYDFGDIDLPYLDLVGADVFEDVGFICDQDSYSLDYQVGVTLLKMKLLLDLKNLQLLSVKNLKNNRLPLEVIDKIKVFVPQTSIVANTKGLCYGDDHSKLLNKLDTQITRLFLAVKKSNKFFWPALLDPKQHLLMPPSTYSMGSMEHARLILRYSLEAWKETPGAIDAIKLLYQKH